MDLQGKNVIYVGGYGGIGYATCSALLRKQIRKLVIFELCENVEKLKKLQKSSCLTDITFIKADVSNRESLKSAYKQASVALDNRLDCVINGSGVYNDQEPELTVSVNMLGVISSTLIAMEHMDVSAGGNGGVIVNISSITALQPNYLMAIYSATKAGILSFTRAMAADFFNKRTGIDFLIICPGGTATDMIMNPVEKSTFKYTSEFHRQKNASSCKQSVEECAECIVKAIEIGHNGTIWVCDLGKLEKIEFPVLWQRNA